MQVSLGRGSCSIDGFECTTEEEDSQDYDCHSDSENSMVEDFVDDQDNLIGLSKQRCKKSNPACELFGFYFKNVDSKPCNPKFALEKICSCDLFEDKMSFESPSSDDELIEDTKSLEDQSSSCHSLKLKVRLPSLGQL